MKHNKNQIPFINLSLFFTILLCFALGKCMAYPSRRANPPYASQYSYSTKPLPFPTRAPSPSDGVLFGNSPPSFSGSFLDILKGTLRGHITMPEHINPQTNHNLALKEICHHTDYPDVCLSTITPFLNDNNFEVTNVLQASMMACSERIKLTLAFVEKHSDDSSQENVGSAFSDCREQFSNALENIERAMYALQTHDLGTVTIMLSAVMADVSSCESGFEDLRSSYKPDSDGSVSIMASNCLVIASLVPS